MSAEKGKLEDAPAPEPPLQKRNVFLVATGWCLGYSAFFIQVTTTSAKAIDLKGTGLSTVPLGIMLFATWIASFIIPKVLARFGNKIVYFIIAVGGAIGAILCLVATEAIDNNNAAFALLVVGSMPQGIAHASTNSYRFAATQFAPPSKAPLAISLVIFGGVLSAVLGPEVSKYTRESLDTEFTGTYILLSALWAWRVGAQFKDETEEEMTDEMKSRANDLVDERVVQAVVMLLPEFKRPEPPASPEARQEEGAAAQTHKAAVTFGELLSRRKYVFGIFGGAVPIRSMLGWCKQRQKERVSFGAMAGLMAGTPVSMKAQGFSFDTSTTTIELHVVGMFAPAIFTGKVVAALGVVQTVAAGLGLLLFGAVLLYISVTEAAVYMVGLTIIGVGWNWSTVASTALITKSYSKEEASTAQGLADGIIIGFLAIAVFTVGFLYDGLNEDWRLFTTVYAAITAVAVVAAIYVWIVGVEDASASPEPPAVDRELTEAPAALPSLDAAAQAKPPTPSELVAAPMLGMPAAVAYPYGVPTMQPDMSMGFAPQPFVGQPYGTQPVWGAPLMMSGHA